MLIFLDATWPFDIPSLRIINLGLYPVLLGLSGSLEFIFLSCLYVLDIDPLSHVGLVKIFFNSGGCCFVLLTGSSALQKLCSFMRSICLLVILEHKSMMFFSENFSL